MKNLKYGMRDVADRIDLEVRRAPRGEQAPIEADRLQDLSPSLQAVAFDGCCTSSPETTNPVLSALGLSIRAEAGPTPKITATLDTPKGRIELT